MPSPSISSDISRGVLRVRSRLPIIDPVILDTAGNVGSALVIRCRTGVSGEEVVERDDATSK
jgi:cation transporter-like permease